MRARRAKWAEVGSSTPFTLLIGVGLIVVPVMVLVLVLPTWEQRTVDAQDAARSAARALAAADDWSEGVAGADQLVYEMVANDGLPAGDVTAEYEGSLAPGGAVTASVTVAVPVGEVPGLGFVGTMHYTATSTQHVDTYRGSAT